tara:strand:+ start:53 stop:211 length:159 start_codon:yes stop_codon:yes gene_type:complete
MIILDYEHGEWPLDHKEADVFLRAKVYVSVTKNIDLTDENGHLIHTITAKED